jgi:small subunit ribosomal protein S1
MNKVTAVWTALADMQAANRSVNGRVIFVTRDGDLIVDVGVRAVIPRAEVGSRKSWGLLGREVSAKIVELDPTTDRVILSRRLHAEEARRRFLDRFQIGEIHKGIVQSVADFGVFVDLGGGTGLVPLGEISWQYIKHPSDVIWEGQEVMVKVISIDKERGRLTLSIRATQPDPWESFVTHHGPGDITYGWVTAFARRGAYVQVAPGVKGHVSLLEMARPVPRSPKEVLELGDEVWVEILRIDREKRRLDLSMIRVPAWWPEYAATKAAEAGLAPEEWVNRGLHRTARCLDTAGSSIAS